MIYTEQMDAEGLGGKLLLIRSGEPRRAPEKQTVSTVTASHKMLTLQALSSSLNAGTAKKGCLGRGEASGCLLAVRPPKRPRPFAHYRYGRKEKIVLPALLQKLVGDFFGGFFAGKFGKFSGTFGGNFPGFFLTHRTQRLNNFGKNFGAFFVRKFVARTKKI